MQVPEKGKALLNFTIPSFCRAGKGRGWAEAWRETGSRPSEWRPCSSPCESPVTSHTLRAPQVTSHTSRVRRQNSRFPLPPSRVVSGSLVLTPLFQVSLLDTLLAEELNEMGPTFAPHPCSSGSSALVLGVTSQLLRPCPSSVLCSCSALVLGVTSYDIHRSIANNSIPVTADQLEALQESLAGAKGRAEGHGQGRSQNQLPGQGEGRRGGPSGTPEMVLDMPKGGR